MIVRVILSPELGTPGTEKSYYFSTEALARESFEITYKDKGGVRFSEHHGLSYVYHGRDLIGEITVDSTAAPLTSPIHFPGI